MGRKKVVQCLVIAVGTGIAAIWLFLKTFDCIMQENFMLGIITGTTGIIATLVAIIMFNISQKSPANGHTWGSLLAEYFIFTLLTSVGHRVLNNITEATKSVGKYQEDLLLHILKYNERTDYGKKVGFCNITSREDYRQKQALTTYGDYESYVERIENGEQNILTKDEVVFLAVTSGTTGKNKVFPITNEMKGPTGRRIGSLMYHFMDMKAGLKLGRALIIGYHPKTNQSPCGLIKAPVSFHMSRYIPFCTAPREAFLIKDEMAALYVHAVFGLREREVSHIEGLMATLIYSFWKLLEGHWQQVCFDIEQGQINPNIGLEENTLTELNKALTADSERAIELRREFQRGFTGIAKRIWPTLRFVRMLSTGGFAHHANVLQKRHLAGVQQLSQVHAATEGFLGANLSTQPGNHDLTALPTYGFLEFIPESHCHESQPQTLFMEQVSVGENYEMVITSPMGLYRYRMGDIVRVVDFLNQCPVYQFQHRLGQILNLYWEKTPENVLYRAVCISCSDLDVSLVDYTATEDVIMEGLLPEETEEIKDTKHYVLFVELEKNEKPYSLKEKEIAKFDQHLREIFEMYDTMREGRSVGPMRVYSLKRGSFLRLKDCIISNTQNQQFKIPRVLRNIQHLKYLLTERI